MDLMDLFEQRFLSALAVATRHDLPGSWQIPQPHGDERAAAAVLVRLARREWKDLGALHEEVQRLANQVDARRGEAGRAVEPVWQGLARAVGQLDPGCGEAEESPAVAPRVPTFFRLELWKFLPASLKKDLQDLAPRNTSFPIRSDFLCDLAQVLMTSQARIWADAARVREAQEVAS